MKPVSCLNTLDTSSTHLHVGAKASLGLRNCETWDNFSKSSPPSNAKQQTFLCCLSACKAWKLVVEGGNHETCRFDGSWHSVLHTCPVAAAEVVSPHWQASNLQAADFLNQHEEHGRCKKIQRSKLGWVLTFKYHKWICARHGTQSSPHLEEVAIGRPVSKDLGSWNSSNSTQLWASLCATHWIQ